MKNLGIAIRCALLTLCLPTWCFAEKVTVAWDANTEPGISGYRVSYGTASGVHPTTLDVGNQTTAAFTGLTPGQRYYFVVRAYTATQVSPASVEVSGVALGLVAVTSTAGSSTIPTGAPVTWTALASGGVDTRVPVLAAASAVRYLDDRPELQQREHLHLDARRRRGGHVRHPGLGASAGID